MVTLSRFSVGELRTDLNTGSVLTHGEHHGENQVSSELPMENAELTQQSMDALLQSENQNSLIDLQSKTYFYQELSNELSNIHILSLNTIII